MTRTRKNEDRAPRTVTLRGGETITIYWAPMLDRWVTIPGRDES